MIAIYEYVGSYAGSPDWTQQRMDNAWELLKRCRSLEEEMVEKGILFPTNSKTGSQVSGDGNGGFRPQNCPIGAPKSAHKEGSAVDRYDPTGAIDSHLLLDFHACESAGYPERSLLVKYDLYIEHPDATPGWSHWGTKAPKSGNRIFRP